MVITNFKITEIKSFLVWILKRIDIISHVVLDDKIFNIPKYSLKKESELGGPVSFSTLIAPFITSKLRIISSIGADFPEKHLKYLHSFENVESHFIQSKKTTRFKHMINKKERKLILLEIADSLEKFVCGFDGSDACLISPVYKEVSWKTLEWGKQMHEVFALDIQGFMREVNKQNEIIKSMNYENTKRILEYPDIVKFSFKEAMCYTKKTSYTGILEKLPKNNIQIVTCGNRGLVYSNQGVYYKLDVPKTIKEKDPTGAGDVLMSMLVAKITESVDLDFALAYGMAFASEAIKNDGVTPLPKDKNYQIIAEAILDTKKRL